MPDASIARRTGAIFNLKFRTYIYTSSVLYHWNYTDKLTVKRAVELTFPEPSLGPRACEGPARSGRALLVQAASSGCRKSAWRAMARSPLPPKGCVEVLVHHGLLLLFLSHLKVCHCLFRYDDVMRNHTLDLRQGRRQLESGLRSFELHRFREAVREMRSLGTSLKGFYHTSAWRGEWKAVMAEQLRLLDGNRETIAGIYDRESAVTDEITWGKRQWTSLLEHSNSVHVTVASSQKTDLDLVVSFVDGLELRNREKLTFTFNETLLRGNFNNLSEEAKQKARLRKDLSEGESSTYMALYDYCVAETRAKRKAFVYYFHVKGACCTRKTELLGRRCVTTWREAMNAFNLEFPSICLRALVDGYDSCGMESQDGTYSGNFWWANCEAVASLLPLTNRFDAYRVEYGIFQYTQDAAKNEERSYRCGYSSFNCNVDHYSEECPRSFYLHKLSQYASARKLPPNFDGSKGEVVYNRKNRKHENFKSEFLRECIQHRKSHT